MPKPKDAPRFAGFASPRYTPTPDILFDELLPDLSPAELRVLLYIIRRTFGFKKDSDDIGVKQLMSGITTKGGKRLDRGTGLGRSTVLGAVKSLEDWGIIERVENTDPELGDLPSTYRLNFGAENLDPPGPENRTPSAEKPGPPRSNGLHPQETASQETGQETPYVAFYERMRTLRRTLPAGEYLRVEAAINRGEPDLATLRARAESAIAEAKKARR